MAIESRNPATEQLIESFEPMADDVVDRLIEDAVRAHRELREMPFADRSNLMRRAADYLDAEKSRFGELLTAEMGKTLKAAIAEVEKCAWVCRYYAERAEAHLADEHIETEARESYVRYLPIGPVLAVMPWNFPFWQVFRFAAPALMAGNSGLLKHASNVPRSALAIERIFREAGFPTGAFSTLLVGSDRVERIIADDRVRAVTLTGSEPAGASVAATAGTNIKKTVLELGGSDAFIVMPSADLDAAVESAVQGRIINNGQSCIAAKRFLVHGHVYPAFRDAFVARFKALTVDDPMLEATDVGPLATSAIRDELDGQVGASVDAGARRLTGAEPIDGRGYYYRPGIIADVPESAPAFGEELFGPVAVLFEVPSIDAAIELANRSRFGLGSAIFTNEPDDVRAAVDGIEAGATFVNTIVASDPRLPFGGVKASGYGRELGAAGIREFVNAKTVSIR